MTNTDKHPKGIAASLLEKRVNEEMNGKACMEVFPNSTLYNDDQVLEALLQGDVQMAAPSLSKFETVHQEVPHLRSALHVQGHSTPWTHFQSSETGQAMKESMTRRGLLGLAFWHNGMKQMSANKPLNQPSGCQWPEIPRAELRRAEGADGASGRLTRRPMAFSEVYGALQTGVVDGQENTWSNIYGKKFFEVQDGITETNHGIIDYLRGNLDRLVGQPAGRCARPADHHRRRSHNDSQRRNPSP